MNLTIELAVINVGVMGCQVLRHVVKFLKVSGCNLCDVEKEKAK